MLGISALLFSDSFSSLKDNGFKEIGEFSLKKDFPMSESWHSLYSRTALLSGARGFGGVYFDKPNERLISSLKDPGNKALKETAEKINEFYHRYPDKPCYIMIVPTACGIYRAELPEAIEAADQQPIIDKLYYDVDPEVIPLDVFNALYSARDDYIFFRTDPYWTQLGAYHAYSSAASKLGIETYSAQNYDIDFTHVEYQGKLAKQSAVYAAKADTIDVFKCKYGSYIKSVEIVTSEDTEKRSSPYRSGKLKTQDKYSYFIGADDYKLASITTTNEDMPSMLMICSDYANCFAPFLAPHYSNITLVDPDDLDEGEKIYDIADPAEFDQIMILFDLDTLLKLDKNKF